MRDDAAVSSPPSASESPPRPVRVIAAGGTIAMRGERAVPALDASALVEQLPQVAGFHLEAESVLSLPSTSLSLSDALDLARRTGAAAASGEGVVLTTGTDTMEEVAVLCGLTYGGEAPSVICARVARSALPSCRRRRPGWRYWHVSARTSTATASRPSSRRSTPVSSFLTTSPSPPR